MKHLIISVIFLALYFGSLFFKDSLNKHKKSFSPPTLSKIRAEFGTPVEVKEVQQKDFTLYSRISGFINKDGFLNTEVSREVSSLIKANSKAKISFEKTDFTGVVERVGTTPNILTGLYNIRLHFKELPVSIINHLVVAYVPTQTIRNALIIPRSAVSLREETPFVYTVDQDQKVQKKAVKLGASDKDFYLISLGLKAGEIVVTSDQRYLSLNEKVFIKK